MTIRVLLVDDQVLFRHGVKAALQPERDIDVVGEADNGNDAVSKTVSLHAQLVLMDLVMPGGDGIAATRAIRQRCPETQVLVLSAYSDAELLRKAAEAGAVGYVLKDISPTNLANAIRAAHGGRTMLSPVIARKMMLHFFHNQGNNHQRGAASRLDGHGLTERELDVLTGVAQGLSDKEIAANLFLSEATVKANLRGLYRKLSLRNRVQAAAFAVERGLLGRPGPDMAH